MFEIPELLVLWQVHPGTRKWWTKFLGKDFQWYTLDGGPYHLYNSNWLILGGKDWKEENRLIPICFCWEVTGSRVGLSRFALGCWGCPSRAWMSRGLVCRKSVLRCHLLIKKINFVLPFWQIDTNNDGLSSVSSCFATKVGLWHLGILATLILDLQLF